MKNIFKFFGAFLTVVLAAALTGCTIEEDLETADVGLHIKVFFPTKVVAGQPMTINGSGFSTAVEIVFPDGVSVTDFEIVSNDMIRVNAPAGISAEGGTITVRTEEGEAVSPLPLTLGNTVITGYSVVEGDVISGGNPITIYGTDLEFITRVEMLDADGNPSFVEDNVFNRKGTSNVIFTVPKKVFDGEFVAKVHTVDGKTFNMPNITYEPVVEGGYWDVVETVVWENDGSVGAAAWSGSPYRFAPEFNSTGEEVYAVPADVWEMMKAGPFYVTFKPAADWWQIRILDAWWAVGNNDANDITPNYEGLIDNGDGTYTVAVDLSGKADLLAVLDAQHLLFAGDGFQILKIYFSEEVWVPGGEGSLEIVKTSIWKNDGSLGEGTWGNTYRFALEGKNGGDASVELPAELWEKLKAGPFKLTVKPVADWWQIRVLTGWWQGQWPAADNSGEGDINVNWTDNVVDNGDGTFAVTIDLTGHEILGLLDEQNLLFAGSGFEILEIYTEEEVWVDGGGGAKEFVIWENDGSLGEGTWGNTYRFALEGKNGGDASVDVPADVWEKFKTGPFMLNVKPVADWWQIRVLTGWWSGQWPAADNSGEGDINVNWTDIVADNGDGTFTVTIDLTGHEIIDLLDEQNLLFAGAGFQILKIYCME